MKTKIFLLVFFFALGLVFAQDKKDKGQWQEIKKLPQAVKMAKPEYPEKAKQEGKTGLVIVQVVVGIDGKAKSASIMKSDNEIFNTSALEAAKNTIYSPALDKNQKPVEASVAIPYKFTLNDKPDANKSAAKKTK